MSKRIKSNGPVIQSRGEAEGVLARIRSRVLNQQTLTADRERELQAVDEKYKGQLLLIEQEVNALTEQLRVWAEANPSEFGTAKSLVMTDGVIGWRIGNPTLKPLSGWTWDRVLEKLKSAAAYAGFVRIKEEVDKASILAQRESLPAGDLRAMGVRVVQDDLFFVDPKVEEVTTRQVVPAEGVA